MAALYAFEFPERLEKLVLLSPQGVLRLPLGLIPRAILYVTVPRRSVIRRYLYWYAPDCVRNDATRPRTEAKIDRDVGQLNETCRQVDDLFQAAAAGPRVTGFPAVSLSQWHTVAFERLSDGFRIDTEVFPELG